MFRLKKNERFIRKMTLHSETNLVRSFFGADFVEKPAVPTVPIVMTDAQAIEKANTFLETNHQLFIPKRVIGKEIGLKRGIYSQSVRYALQHEASGIPIYQARIAIGQHKVDGAITSAVDTLDYDLPDTFDTSPKLNAVQVKQLVQKRFLGKFKKMTIGEPRLFIYQHSTPKAYNPHTRKSVRKRMTDLSVGKVGQKYLVWQVLMGTRSPSGGWELLVDATSGDFIAVKDRRMYAKPRGRVFWPDPIRSKKDSSLSWKSATAETLSNVCKEVDLDNLENPVGGEYSLAGSWAKIAEKEEPGFQPPKSQGNFLFDPKNSSGKLNPVFLDVMAYYYIDKLVCYLRDLGIEAFVETPGTPIAIDPHACYGQDRAYFDLDDEANPYVALGDEDEMCQISPDATDPGVIVHEYGHAVHYYLLDSDGASDRHAITSYEEGFCDFLSTCWLDRFNESQYKRTEVMLWDRRGMDPEVKNRRVNLGINKFRFNHEDYETWDIYLQGDIHASALWEIFLKMGGNSKDPNTRIKAADEIIGLYIDMLSIVPDCKSLEDLVKGLIEADKAPPRTGARETVIKTAYKRRGLDVEI